MKQLYYFNVVVNLPDGSEAEYGVVPTAPLALTETILEKLAEVTNPLVEPSSFIITLVPSGEPVELIDPITWKDVGVAEAHGDVIDDPSFSDGPNDDDEIPF